MIEILIDRIKEGKQSDYQTAIKEQAELNLSFYTGKNQEEILFDYRKLETQEQKSQRKRITIGRTKHVCANIENILDQLQALDSPAINIEGKETEQLKALVYENNIESQAFNFVKYYNIIDPNAFLVASIDDFGDVQFDAIESEYIFDFKIKNDKVEYLVLKFKDKKNSSLVRYRIYLKNKVVFLEQQGKGFLTITDEYETNSCLAYHLGYILNSETQFKTYKSIIDPASELFKQLIWDGSEYDIIKGTHGIVKTFAYAPKCNFRNTSESGEEYCDGGTLYLGRESKGNCPNCKGSGLRIHTSSQDIIHIEEPLDNSNILSLDKYIHTVHIPESLITFRKEDIKELEDKIIRSVFNSNNITQNEIVKTATELTIDLKGVYSALTKLGNKVSDVFIFMVEAINSLTAKKDIQVFHGYSMELNMDTLEHLLDTRKKAVESGVSNEVVKVIDMNIQKKQHMENPEYLIRFGLWESFKPFKDKREQEKMSILAGLPNDNKYKILSIYWETIKVNVMNKNENFYELSYEEQKELIDAEVDVIREEVKDNLIVPNFDEFA